LHWCNHRIDSATTQPTPLKDLDKQAATYVDTQNDEEEDDEEDVVTTSEDILTGKWLVDTPFLASGQYNWQIPYANNVNPPAASKKELPYNFIIMQKEISRDDAQKHCAFFDVAVNEDSIDNIMCTMTTTRCAIVLTIRMIL
jgi:hypothetical protein